ncbi:DnaD domain-containing protein [Paenibacillus pini]|uniref:Chromosome replication initiation protein dnaD n=1 Tax=Paenibacillus pini JCM 16418 TaxID=1236976 RepID=W7YKV6_9BACL|nr:DnaD domain-containing protein [Paenibacillus pini]GAF09112.1 chromosome replication initiation protein dnaD [Paenibacillus pini JCM 16418]
MDSAGWKTWAEGASSGMGAGMAVIPYVLLRYYRKLKLSDSEMLLLIHLIAFKQVEQKDLPTMEELAEVMGSTAQSVAHTLQKLMKDGLISIDEEWDEVRGIQNERYNVSGLYDKLSRCLVVEEKNRSFTKGNRSTSARPQADEENSSSNMFTIFEKEFGRPLSPMECETISSWIDQDRYPGELILMALKEAVFAGKIHFRYIDRILLEWSRNRVKNVSDAKAYTQKFRSSGRV